MKNSKGMAARCPELKKQSFKDANQSRAWAAVPEKVNGHKPTPLQYVMSCLHSALDYRNRLSTYTFAAPCVVHFCRYDAIWLPRGLDPPTPVSLSGCNWRSNKITSLRQDGLIFAISPQPDRAELPSCHDSVVIIRC